MTLETLLNVCDCDLVVQIFIAGWDIRGSSESVLGLVDNAYLHMQVFEINMEDNLMKIWLKED